MNLEKMLKGGLIRKVLPSEKSASSRIRKAERWLALAEKLVDMDLDTALEKTYDSILESGLAIMANEGYRPTSRQGHHFAVMEFLCEVLGIGSSELHTLRKSRNLVIYEDEEDIITEDYISEALEFATMIVSKAKKSIEEK